MPEPRPPGDLAGTKTTGRTRVLGPGGKPIAPECQQERASEPPAQPQAPAARAPAAASNLGSPDWESVAGALTHAGCGGNLFRASTTGRRECDRCHAGWWRPDKLKSDWVRV